jgi:hypothetical protein
VRKLQPVPTHPDPVAATRRAEHKRFLGEELAPDAEGSPWLVQAVLGGAPPLEITRDGVIPWRFNGVLPLRHGYSRTGAPASCLLAAPGVERLKADGAGESSAAEVECAACRAWQAAHRPARRSSPTSPVLARLRAALDFGKAA